ncbi:peptidyl-prolyl cis-trans isomerase NIMA-interacting 1, putative [Eimeria tenella]|uniref:Peptidyl-prolyl cis-trans isomerase n=1 Tax=Eimeria tenella TaxID=5802 RepID=U6L0D8_EIMTE|nr:peptidyl-prolyl cis-trans isomerase NIMA-interacting 1, putative [Eimeria tenella]CDJ43661.1 peptidyl-prolyl cis-trans isomerase NIMA-interacting 1, putative [Eimeria tenella]|eukprot:XP_013234410.1 peptidyl-prolyl cis-trans isomerase NIMA-interacting 1, putative [Eimeria tenella]
MSVRCRHLLVKHSGSRNPVSRRTQQAVTRSKSEALLLLQELQQQLQQQQQELEQQQLPLEQRQQQQQQLFAALAQQHSDCSSFRQGGDLGFFSKGQMQQQFEFAAFNLLPQQLSDVVESDSGLHLILRIA